MGRGPNPTGDTRKRALRPGSGAGAKSHIYRREMRPVPSPNPSAMHCSRRSGPSSEWTLAAAGSRSTLRLMATILGQLSLVFTACRIFRRSAEESEWQTTTQVEIRLVQDADCARLAGGRTDEISRALKHVRARGQYRRIFAYRKEMVEGHSSEPVVRECGLYARKGFFGSIFVVGRRVVRSRTRVWGGRKKSRAFALLPRSVPSPGYSPN